MSLRRFRYEPIRLGHRATAFLWIIMLVVVGWAVVRVPYEAHMNSGHTFPKQFWIWQKPVDKVSNTPPFWSETYTIDWLS